MTTVLKHNRNASEQKGEKRKNPVLDTFPLTGRALKGYRKYAQTIIIMMLISAVFSIHAFAASDPLAAIDNLSDFIFGLIRAIGLILLGLGIVQVGLSFKSHDPSQRANGFLTLAGGLIITFAKEILNLIIG